MATVLTTRSDWLIAHPPGRERLSQTLMSVSERVRNGEDFRHAVREFLDEFALRSDDRSRVEAIEAQPPLTGDVRHDAYLGALAEHLAALHGLTRPASLSPSAPCIASKRWTGGRSSTRSPLWPGSSSGAGVVAEMYVVGGAAIALAFDERRATRDVDAVFEPKSVVYEAATVVAEDLDLPGGWLNDAVKGFLEGDDPAAVPVLDLPGLRCLAASSEVPLALKVLAHGIGEDEGDVRLLADELGLETADEVLTVTERTFGDRLDPAARFFVEQIFGPE